MALTPGTRLGPYEVTAQIGEGGMGQVYRATDTKLKRQVAIKILPPAVAADADRLARFQREAEVLASLNHPNIAAIHGLEESGGITALVMELVEGEDLSQLIAGRAGPSGPAGLPLDEALPIAKQIAEALEAAHEQGIIHRDLKPANIKVRPDGTVKVLDFGLAKAIEPANASMSSVSMSPTITSPAMMTGVGMILGTAAYMSPEQAKGRTADKRSDVWAFGAVLYEMLSGRRAFSAEDVSETLAAVLMKEPDWTALPATVPPTVVTVLRRCLQKNAKQRIGDAQDVRLALEGAFDAPTQQVFTTPAVPAPRRALWRQAVPWAAGAVVVGGLGAGTAVWMRPAAPARVARFVITAPADQPFQFVSATPAVALSPDGSRLVYRTVRDMNSQLPTGVLYQRALGQAEATRIPGTEGANGFFFSPDGNWIVFANAIDNTLKRIAVSGGPSQTICPLDGLFRGGSWGSDDTIVFATAASKGLRRVPATGGEAQVLTKVDTAKDETDHFWPELLPDGKGVIFTAWNGTVERSRIVALSWPSGNVSELVRGGSQPHLSPTGHLVYAVGGTLSAVRFNNGSLEAEGSPVPVIEGLASSATTGAASYAIAADGSLLYVEGSGATIAVPRTLVWVNRKGQEELIPVLPRAYTYARLSPDGTRVALDARDGQNDIWIWDLARQTLQRLTNDPGLNRLPVWTPDGTRVAFSAEREGAVENIFWQKADGSDVPERLSVGPAPQGPASFSPDGKRLLFQTPFSAPFDIGMVILDGERREEMLLKTTFSELNGVVSPDGRWLAYESNESGQAEIYLTPFPDVRASKRQVSARGGTRPLWSKDGRELFYYVGPDTIMALPVRLGADVVLGNPQVVVKGPYAFAANAGRHYDVSPDGQRFLLLKDAPAPDQQKPVVPEIHLVQNWAEELKAKVPAGK